MGRGAIAQSTVGSNMAVLPPSRFDQHLRLPKSIENLSIQKLISQTTVERFNVPVFPGTAGLNEERLHVDLFKPPSYGMSRKLRSII